MTAEGAYRSSEEALRGGLLIGDRVVCRLGDKAVTGRVTLIVPAGVSIYEDRHKGERPCVMPPWTVELAPAGADPEES